MKEHGMVSTTVLVQDTDQWWPSVDNFMSLWLPKYVGKFLTLKSDW